MGSRPRVCFHKDREWWSPGWSSHSLTTKLHFCYGRTQPLAQKVKAVKATQNFVASGRARPPHPLPSPGRAGLGHSVPDYCYVPRMRTERYLRTETRVKAVCLRTVAAVVGLTEGKQTLDLNFVPMGLEE